VRAHNTLWGVGDKLGIAQPSLDPDRLMRAAERTTRLSDWGTREFEPALHSVLASARSGAGLTSFGRMALRHILLRSLVNKLRLGEVFQSDPALHDVPVRRPVFIIGWYRSGTTLLHRLLADLPELRAPETWELTYPVPGPGPVAFDRQRRISKVERMLWLARQAVPTLDEVHDLRARSAEESTFLLDNELTAVYAIHAFGAHAHGDWLARRDLHYAYAAVRRQLQLLSEPDDPRRWVFKCPFSMWHLETLLDVFDDAVIIRPHRAVTEALPSVCSLSAILQTGFRNEVDRHELGRFWSDFYLQGLQHSRRARTTHPRTVFLDVDYRALTADPAGTARWLREQLELEEDPTLSLPIEAPRAKKPYRSVHTYTLAQFGLEADDLEDRFGPYLAPMPGARPAPMPDRRPEA